MIQQNHTFVRQMLVTMPLLQGTGTPNIENSGFSQVGPVRQILNGKVYEKGNNCKLQAFKKLKKQIRIGIYTDLI